MGDIGRIFDPTQNFLSPIFNPSDPDVPTPPDTNATIEAQRRAQQLTQITPQGNINYGTIGAGGQFIPRANAEAVQVTESPFQQQFRTGSEGIALGLLGQINQPLGAYSSAADVAGGLNIPLSTNVAGDTQRITDQMYQAGLRQIQPQLTQSREDLIQNLADRGIPLSSEAAQKELNRFEQSQGNQLQDLAFGAIGAGQQEQQRQATLAAGLRGQQLNEGVSLANLGQQQRAQQFGEIGALGGFAAPFQPLNAPTVDVAGIINQGYANQMGQYSGLQKKYANQQALLGDILGTGAMIASDSRLKENVKYHSDKNGYKLYDFNYIGSDLKYRGVMAQDILETNPEAVTVMPNGFYGVHYDKLGLEMETL